MGTIRDELNQDSPGRTSTALKLAGAGDALNKLLMAATPTESAAAVTNDVITTANPPKTLFRVKAQAGTVTGEKKLLIGQISGAGAIVPKTGEAVWDGGSKILFNHADAVTNADLLYSTAADTVASLLQRTVDLEGAGS